MFINLLHDQKGCILIFQHCRGAVKCLRRGIELLEVNGQLLYFSNSMNPLENEAVVAAVLAEAPGRS